jgi:hypothetical protein
VQVGSESRSATSGRSDEIRRDRMRNLYRVNLDCVSVESRGEERERLGPC